MKGENEMTFNPEYAQLLGAELQRNRMREAEKERLVRQVSRYEPSLAKKILVILRARWSDLWDGDSHQFPPVSQLPKKSTTL